MKNVCFEMFQHRFDEFNCIEYLPGYHCEIALVKVLKRLLRPISANTSFRYTIACLVHQSSFI